MGLCLWEVPAVESLSHASGVPAPFDKGAFGCTADTGRVGVVTNCKKPPCALTAAARRPFDKGAFGCTTDTGRVREVTNCKKPRCALTAAARRNTSLREGGGLGRSPKTEGASGRIVNSQDRGGTSPGGVRVPVPTRRKDPVKSVWGIDTTSKYQP